MKIKVEEIFEMESKKRSYLDEKKSHFANVKERGKGLHFWKPPQRRKK